GGLLPPRRAPPPPRRPAHAPRLRPRRFGDGAARRSRHDDRTPALPARRGADADPPRANEAAKLIEPGLLIAIGRSTVAMQGRTATDAARNRRSNWGRRRCRSIRP